MGSSFPKTLAIIACLLLFVLANQAGEQSIESGSKSARRRNLQAGAMRIIIDFSYSDYIYNDQAAADRAKYVMSKRLIIKTRDLYISLLRVKG